MRKTIAAVESSEGASGAGIGGAGITETMGGIRGYYEEGCGVGGVVTGDAALHDARIIIDMDRVRTCNVSWLARVNRTVSADTCRLVSSFLLRCSRWGVSGEDGCYCFEMDQERIALYTSCHKGMGEDEVFEKRPTHIA